MKPTIDEAIKYCKTLRLGYNTNGSYTCAGRMNLAIQALTEMRDRQNLSHTSEKPRTWRDVTLGEVQDAYKYADVRFANSAAILSFRSVGESVLAKQPNPLKHWRSMGA